MSTKYHMRPSLGLASLLSFSLLTGCGGSSDSSAPAAASTPSAVTDTDTDTQISPEIFTGIFLDSAVTGLNYKTESQQGTTNARGEFDYQADETVTFSIGQTVFPELAASVYVTPLSVFKTDDINTIEVVNSLRLLQSLDIDADLTNGIELPANIHTLVTNNINFSDENFEQIWLDIIELTDLPNKSLITADDAIYHFQQTLASISDGSASSCGKTHAKIGWSGTFETLAHNVAGKATIVDDCTIVVEQFDYDGEGPIVYFYGAIAHDYASDSAFRIGNQLNGRSYSNDEITLKLPQGTTLDDLSGMSVWCVDFDVSFGNVEFTQ